MMPFLIGFGVIGAHFIKKWQTGRSPSGIAAWDNWGRIGTITLAFAPVFTFFGPALYFGIEGQPPAWWLEFCIGLSILPWVISVGMILYSTGYSERQVRILNLPRGERPKVTVMGMDLETVELQNGIEWDSEQSPKTNKEEAK